MTTVYISTTTTFSHRVFRYMSRVISRGVKKRRKKKRKLEKDVFLFRSGVKYAGGLVK